MKTIRQVLLFLFLLFLQIYGQSALYPDLHGEELRNKLIQDYKPQTVLSYNDARDELYAVIDNHNDSLKCVYSGYTLYIPYNYHSPRDLTNAANPIINAEHTWPQSKGASGNAKSDMHHLFATNAVPNAARASFPFDEINDQQTDKWYRFTNILTSIPSSSIDFYSELDENSRFEPPEAHKGNVARAMFYFYTMYKNQADSEDPNFFNLQKDVLRKWNSMDPVDEAEIIRTNLIAHHQENKPNPFIIDTTLIGRVYFGVTTSVFSKTNDKPEQFSLEPNYPNPFNGSTIIRYTLNTQSYAEIKVYSVNGEIIQNWYFQSLNSGEHSLLFSPSDLSSGIYYYTLTTNIGKTSRKMLYLK